MSLSTAAVHSVRCWDVNKVRRKFEVIKYNLLYTLLRVAVWPFNTLSPLVSIIGKHFIKLSSHVFAFRGNAFQTAIKILMPFAEFHSSKQKMWNMTAQRVEEEDTYITVKKTYWNCFREVLIVAEKPWGCFITPQRICMSMCLCVCVSYSHPLTTPCPPPYRLLSLPHCAAC